MQHIFAASLRLSYFWHALPFFVTAVRTDIPESLSGWTDLLKTFYSLVAFSTSFLRVEGISENTTEGLVGEC